MLYKTDIGNLALGRLGTSLRITDLDTDNSTQAKVIRNHFGTSLDTFLESHNWGFATVFAALPLISLAPDSGYGYVYGYPADALTIRQVAAEDGFHRTEVYEDEKIPFEELLTGAGMTIHTNMEKAYAEYTKKLHVDSGFPNYFARGLAAQLSLEIAASLITNNFGKVEQALNSKARQAMGEAIAIDLGRTPRKQDSASPFIRARS